MLISPLVILHVRSCLWAFFFSFILHASILLVLLILQNVEQRFVLGRSPGSLARSSTAFGRQISGPRIVWLPYAICLDWNFNCSWGFRVFYLAYCLPEGAYDCDKVAPPGALFCSNTVFCDHWIFPRPKLKWGVKKVQFVACWTRDRKVASSIPGGSCAINFFSGDNFLCWLLSSVRSNPGLSQRHVKKTRLFSQKSRRQVTAKNACTFVWLNEIGGADYAVQVKCRNLSELTRYSSGNTRLRSSHLAEPLWTDPGERIESVCANWSPLFNKKWTKMRRRKAKPRIFTQNPRTRGKSHRHQTRISWEV